jgi:hypothetical protein
MVRLAIALGLVAGLGPLLANETTQFITYLPGERRLVALAERPSDPHVERRRDGEEHTLIIHHAGGKFVLTPGFSAAAMALESQEALLALYQASLKELCRLVQQPAP